MGRSDSRVELAGCLEQSDKLNATPTNTRGATLPVLLSNTSSYFGNHPWGAPPSRPTIGTRARLLAPESKWISRSSQMDFSASSDCDFLASIFPDLWFLAPQSLICSCGGEGIVCCLVSFSNHFVSIYRSEYDSLKHVNIYRSCIINWGILGLVLIYLVSSAPLNNWCKPLYVRGGWADRCKYPIVYRGCPPCCPGVGGCSSIGQYVAHQSRAYAEYVAPSQRM